MISEFVFVVIVVIFEQFILYLYLFHFMMLSPFHHHDNCKTIKIIVFVVVEDEGHSKAISESLPV